MGVSHISLVENAVERLAYVHQLDAVRVRMILNDFLQSLHETAFKGSSTQALQGVYFGLGDEAAWHFFGLIYSCHDGASNDSITESRSMFYETALRLDSRMSRFSCILERWKVEKEHDDNEDRLNRQETDTK